MSDRRVEPVFIMCITIIDGLSAVECSDLFSTITVVRTCDHDVVE